jgi:hypothetical protein
MLEASWSTWLSTTTQTRKTSTTTAGA